MKFFKIIFFHIYNSYYKDGNFHNDIPFLTAYGITGTSISCAAMTVLAVTNYLITCSKPSVLMSISIFAICMVACFFIYIYNSKFETIYSDIKDSKWDNTSTKFVVWIIIISGYSSVGVYSYLFNS